MKKTWAINSLFVLTLAAVALTPFIITQQLLYPFFVPKALFFRSVILLGLPFYAYLIITNPTYRPSFKNPLTISLVIFLIVNIIAGIFGVNPGRSFWGNYERMGGNYHLIFLTFLYFYILLFAGAKEKWLAILLNILVWVGALTSIYAIFEKLGMTPWVPDDSLPLRMSSIFGNPIFFASFLIIPLFLSIFFYFQSEGQKRYWYLAAAFVQTVGIILSGTRGALVGLILGLIIAGIYYIWAEKKYRLPVIGSIGIVVAIFIALAIFSSGNAQSSVLSRLTKFNDSNSKARLIQWGMALKGFKANPILGVGPENYYVISNTYFNRELYSYDYSWFDKPHNYLLEVLTTTGIFGLLSYLAIFGFGIWGVFKSVKADVLGRGQAAALIAAAIAYQAQNFFVFDTTSAAMAFFVFVGLCGFLCEPIAQKSKQVSKNISPIFSSWIFYGLAILAVYGFFITDWITMRVTKDINYAYAIDIKDPVLAKSYFNKAGEHSFIYDPAEIAVKTEEFTVRAAQDSTKKEDKEFINSMFNDSISRLEQVTAKTKNNPIYWFKLGNMYSQLAYYNKSGYDLRGETAVNNAIALVPNRIEPLFFLVQLRALQNNIPEVVKISEQINELVPNNPEATWRLALAYKDGGNVDLAAETAEKAFSIGYHFKLVREFRWLINYYADKENYQRVRELYEQAIDLSPDDYQLYASLATVYAKLGENQKAILAAQKVLQLNPESKALVEAFLKALQNQ
jgi:O-antigen ligase/tetratricopeptide (TPR) repeat protein